MDGMKRAEIEIAVDTSIQCIPNIVKVLSTYYSELINAGFTDDQAFQLVFQQAAHFSL